MDGITIGPDDGERVERPERAHRILCELPGLEVIDMRFGPGFEGVDPHTHADHADCFYVLEGEAEFMIGGEQLQHRAGGLRGGAGRHRARLPKRRPRRAARAQHARSQHRLRAAAAPGRLVRLGLG